LRLYREGEMFINFRHFQYLLASIIPRPVQ
jgi:hypothetical protein